MFAPHNDIGTLSALVLYQKFSWYPIIYAYTSLTTAVRNVTWLVCLTMKTMKTVIVFAVRLPFVIFVTLTNWLRTLRLWLHLYSLACLWNLWFFVKDFPLILLTVTGQMFQTTLKRPKPPLCLTDGRYGRHCYMKLKDVKLHYVESGNDSQPLLLCLHSIPEFWFSWRYQLSQLSHLYWVVAMDLRGFGDSETSNNGTINSIEEATDDIIKFLELNGREECLVIGHGLGGLVGWNLLHTYPGVVTKFISLSCPHPAVLHSCIRENPPEQRHWTKYIYSSILPWLPQRMAICQDEKIVENLLKHRCYCTTFINEDDIEVYKYIFSRKEDWEAGMQYLKHFALSNNFLPSQYEKQVKTPVLMLLGEKDDIFSRKLYENTLQFHENLIKKSVRGASHWLQQEKPKHLNSLIIDFFEEHNNKMSAPAAGNSLMERVIGSKVRASLSLVSSTINRVAAFGANLPDDKQ